MKNPNQNTVSKLIDLPNIGKAMVRDFQLIGIDRPNQLIGKDPYQLYLKLCKATGSKQDPCVLDTFMSAVHFMDSGDARPWWTFTEERKKRMASLNQLSE